MKLNENTINDIKTEYEDWKELMYAGKSKEERQKLGQFFTPPELSIKMVEKFTTLNGTCLDPTCGAGNLLIAMFFGKIQYYNETDKSKTIQDCLDELYGIEIDPEILKICHGRMEHLCEYVNKKYNTKVAFNPKHFQLGDTLNDPISSLEFWLKEPFS